MNQTLQQVWTWLHLPQTVWWIYGGGIIVLLLLGSLKAIRRKKKSRRMDMAPHGGALSPMRNGRD